MIPTSLIKDILNTSQRDAKFFGNCFVRERSAERSYFQNFDFFKNMGSVLGARRIAVSFLIDHVRHIVAMGTKKQMLWTYTARIVAFMKNMQSGWNRPLSDLPRQSMRVLLLPIYTKKAIALPMFTGRPFPAIMKRDHLYFRPELLMETSRFSSHKNPFEVSHA